MSWLWRWSRRPRRELDRPLVTNGGAHDDELLRAADPPVCILLDGTRPVPASVARSVTGLVAAGRSITVAIVLPTDGWTLNGRLAQRYRRQRATRLYWRHQELMTAVIDGPAGRNPTDHAGADQLQICWTTAKPTVAHQQGRRLAQRLRGRLVQWLRRAPHGRAVPIGDPSLRFTGFDLAAMPARINQPATPTSRVADQPQTPSAGTPVSRETPHA